MRYVFRAAAEGNRCCLSEPHQSATTDEYVDAVAHTTDSFSVEFNALRTALAGGFADRKKRGVSCSPYIVADGDECGSRRRAQMDLFRESSPLTAAGSYRYQRSNLEARYEG